MLLKFLATLFMLTGLLLTVSPKIPGLFIIAVTAILYAFMEGITSIDFWVGTVIIFLLIIGELGARAMRYYLTENSKISRLYSTDTTVCNLAGILVTDAIFGPINGLIVWELFIGKSWIPRLDAIFKVLIRLIGTSVLRSICGLLMIILIYMYVFV